MPQRVNRRRGSAMVEFALIAPMLLLVMAGVLDYSLALRTAIVVADAARAGAQYGSLTAANSSDISGMQAAARNAAPTLTGLTVTAEQACQCSDGTAASCSGSCSTGALSVYVRVTATATAPLAFRYPGLAFSGAVSSSATMRAQ